MKKTQRQKIISYLLEFGSVTSWEAYRDLGIMQFGARIKELKEEGYLFETRWENLKSIEGKKGRFKRYYLLK